MTTSHLVLFDADRIKDYVFATGRLKEIRGASEQVRRLTDFTAEYQADTFQQFGLGRWFSGATEGVIYASGGAGAVLFADAQRAADFCVAIEQVFRRQTASATLTAISVPVDYAGAASREQAEADAQRSAATKLACRKASRPQCELIPGGGVIRFCASDRLRPASAHVKEGAAEGFFASEATANKRFNNRQYRTAKTVIKSQFWQAFERYLGERNSDVDRALWREAIDPGQDLGTIASQARPTGYVALVYVDGDRIGKTINSVVREAGFHGYQQFSQALAHAATQATAEALAVAYANHPPDKQEDPDEPGRRARFLPFEVITIGGDDVILMCTGEHGVAIAQHICERFGPLLGDFIKQQKTPIQLQTLPTASAGVVIAHDSLPIVQLERRGRDLLKSAKQRDGGGLDFHIVSTPALAELKTVRAEAYTRGSTGLTSRPYDRPTMGKLLRHARDLRGMEIPGSKRADLYRACAAGRIQATLDVLTVQARMRSGEREALLETLLGLGYGPAYPFRQDAERKPPYHTALIDLLELMEFVAEKEGTWGASSARK